MSFAPLRRSFVTAAAATLLGAGLATPAAAQTVLRYSNWLPAGYPVRVQILEPYFAEIEKVTDPGEIASWGVMTTPALVVDDEVVLAGRVPAPAQVAALLAR